MTGHAIIWWKLLENQSLNNNFIHSMGDPLSTCCLSNKINIVPYQCCEETLGRNFWECHIILREVLLLESDAVSTSSTCEYESPWPNRFRFRMKFVLLFRDFTANGRKRCFSGFNSPQVRAKSKSLPKPVACLWIL